MSFSSLLLSQIVSAERAVTAWGTRDAIHEQMFLDLGLESLQVEQAASFTLCGIYLLSSSSWLQSVSKVLI